MGGARSTCQSSQPAVRVNHVGRRGFDVTTDGVAQLKDYQWVSKSLPIRLVTSNKRLLQRPAHTINLPACACQAQVTAGAQKACKSRVGY